MINPMAMKAYEEYYKLAKENNITMVQLAQSLLIQDHLLQAI